MSSVFETLNVIDVNEHTEKKGKLTYLSWAWAWAETKKKYPEMNSKVYENIDGWNYHHDGKTAWVKTSVTIEGLEHIEYLPIMDFKNNSIPLDSVTSTAVNKAIQRSITKCCSRFGLGLYVYSGEDLPDVPTWPDPSMKEEYIQAFNACFEIDDKDGMVELYQELCDNEDKVQGNKQRDQIWRKLSSDQRGFIKQGLKN